MRRRVLLRSMMAGVSFATGSGVVSPHLARAQGSRTLRFVPASDVAILDPTFSPGIASRNHGLVVFDTLYGVDENFSVQPQMVEGHVVENGGLTWTMRLREGLVFHDGQPVRARDVIASLRRWAARDAFGGSLFEIVDDISGPDDRTIRWRLKAPFPKLPLALGKVGSIVAFIMPERLAETPPAAQVKEIVGSGPFRFQADEHVPGSRLVYTRFAEYRPRTSGAPSLLAGPKIVNFDRVEWQVIPDPSTAAAALQRGEVDWVEQPLIDMLPTLRSRQPLSVGELDPLGNACMLRFNQLLPPFDNVAVRRAVMSALSQDMFMEAVAGDDRALWRDGTGYFSPGSAMASAEGMSALTGPRDLAAARQAIVAAGYKGEPILMLGTNDLPAIGRLGDVAADLLKRLGFNVDYVVLDWGAMLLRMANRNPIDNGGWNAFCVYVPGVTQIDPSAHNFLRAQGDRAIAGWPRDPKLEALRDAWFRADAVEEQARIGVAIQKEAFESVPYVPLGTFYQPTAYRKDLMGMLKGLPLFWNIRRA